MGKRSKHRRKQLREIRERRLRYLPKLPQEPFSWKRFFSRHGSEIFFFLCLIAAIAFIYSLGHNKKNDPQVEALSSAVSQAQINSLNKRFPQGYRVFALSKKKVIPLNIDTLPDELKIDWGVSRIIHLSKEEIRFRIGRVTYRSEVLAPSMTIKLPRRQGQAASIIDINDIRLSVEILTEYNTGIFFVFGFKKG